jgi:D-apiose dehydrogenase
MNDVRMAIIAATGTARKRVVPAVRGGGLCTIAAIHGRDEAKLAALANQNSVPRYFVDAERMLDQTKPDFVFIGSPPVLHREHIRLCAERNIPFLCEKPLCLSTSEATAIESLLAARQTPFRIAHHLRHQPGVAALRRIIADNTFGKLHRVGMQ